MGKIKILEVIADSGLSGAPRHVLTLSKRLDKAQFEVILICPKGWLAKEAEKNGIKIIKLPLKSFADLSSVLKLKKMIKNINPGIIHLHGIRAGWLGVMAARKLKKKIIYTEHLYTKNYHLQSRLREWIQLQGLFYILKNVRRIIAPSRAVKKFLTKKFKITSKRIKVIYNGLEDVSLSRGLSPRKATACNVARDNPRIGFIGSLNYQKGVDILVRAFKKVKKEFPTSRLEIIGDGPLKKRLNANFLGAKKDICRYLVNWQMLIIPSRSESFSQTAIEAAIMSKPVVAANVGGLPEVVIDKKTGILVKPNDSNSLTRAIIYLLKDPQVGEEIGRRARMRYERLFTAEKMVEKIEKIYEKI